MFGGSASVLKVCCIFLAWIICTQCYHHIAKRALLFPETFVLQLTCCIAVPGTLPNRTLALNLCMQSNFNAPSNISQLTPTVIQARSTYNSAYDFERKTLYMYITNVLDDYGLNGEHCLLRSICEIAETPMDTHHMNSILENILHYILTPSDDINSQNIDYINQSDTEMNKYIQAEINDFFTSKFCL